MMQMLRRWGWMVALITLLVGATSFGVSMVLPRVYVATATVLVQQQASSVTGPQYQDVLASERLARTYAQMILANPVLEPIAAQVGLTTEELRRRLSTRPLLETQLIQITAEDRSPVQAQWLANTVAQTFMDQARRQSAGSFASAKEDLARQMARLQNEMETTSQALDRLRGTVVTGQATPQDQLLFQQLQSQLNQAQFTYSNLLKTSTEIELAEARATEGLRLVDPAVEPTRPSRPNVPLITLAGVLVGLLAAIGLAALLQHADDTLKAREDAGRELGLPVLGVVGRFSADLAGLVMVEAPRSPVAEHYRTLRTNLQASALPSTVSSILVSSASSRDGKTTVAANLAVAMAQSGKSVLLVDANLRHPTVHHLFDLPGHRGLTDMLAAGLTLEDVALETNVPGLRIVPAGSETADPTALLSSPWMRWLIKELRKHAHIVVIDSPPALAVADGLLLAPIVDATLLVVRSGTTSRALARRAAEDLKSVGSPLLGVVVNAAPSQTKDEGYGTTQRLEADDARSRTAAVAEARRLTALER